TSHPNNRGGFFIGEKELPHAGYKECRYKARSDCLREGAGGEVGEVAEVFGGDTRRKRHAPADSKDVWRVSGRPGGKRVRTGSAGRRRADHARPELSHG